MNINKSNDLQKAEEIAVFKPTALMEKFVETAVKLGTDTVAEIVRETSMAESTYYEWKKDPEFIKWMNEYANQLIRGDGWKLNNIGMRKAKQDHRYWESMQKIVGNIKQDGGNNTNVGIIVEIERYKDE